MNATHAQMLAIARNAGYDPTSVEELRPNRWLITMRAPTGDSILVLAQRRHLILAADVQDLSEILRLRRFPSGYLLAVEGRFSPEALRTARELCTPRILLCVDLPPAGPAPANGALERA
jgi:hypothetical protein